MGEPSINLRPCVVGRKKKGYFHCWEEKQQPVGAADTIGGPPAGQIAYMVGIVEFEDGSVTECLLREIRFTDRVEPPKEKPRKSVRTAPPRWAPEGEIEEACMWITKTVKPSKWPCGSDGEKACDALCKQCWEKWKENGNHEKA